MEITGYRCWDVQSDGTSPRADHGRALAPGAEHGGVQGDSAQRAARELLLRLLRIARAGQAAVFIPALVIILYGTFRVIGVTVDTLGWWLVPAMCATALLARPIRPRAFKPLGGVR